MYRKDEASQFIAKMFALVFGKEYKEKWKWGNCITFHNFVF